MDIVYLYTFDILYQHLDFYKIIEFIGKPIELMVIWVVVPMLEILILLMGVGIFTLILSNIVGVL